MNWNFLEILTKDPSSAWGCDTSGNIPPCGVALRRTCRCTEFHCVKTQICVTRPQCVKYLRQLWYQMGFGDVLNSVQMYLRTPYNDYSFLSFLVSVMRLNGTGLCVIACRLIRKLRRVVVPQMVNSITSWSLIRTVALSDNTRATQAQEFVYTCKRCAAVSVPIFVKPTRSHHRYVEFLHVVRHALFSDKWLSRRRFSQNSQLNINCFKELPTQFHENPTKDSVTAARSYGGRWSQHKVLVEWGRLGSWLTLNIWLTLKTIWLTTYGNGLGNYMVDVDYAIVKRRVEPTSTI